MSKLRPAAEVKLKYVCRTVGGGTPDKENLEFWDGDIPWVSPKDMGDLRISRTEDHISRQAVRASATTIVPAASVLVVVRSGILRHTLPVGITLGAFAINQDIKALIPDERLDASFLAYFIKGNEHRFLSEWRKPGTTVESIEQEIMQNCLVRIPSADEQATITDFLDRRTSQIDNLIAKKERLAELLDEKRTSLISRAVTLGLDPAAPMKDSGSELLGRVPQHWATMAFKRICSRNVVGIAEAATHAYADQGVPLIRSTNLSERGLLLDDVLCIDRSLADENRSRYLRAGDILTVRTGNAGISSAVPESLAGSQCFTLLVSTLKRGHCTDYYVAFLNSSAAKRFFSLESWGTAQMNISVPIIQNVPCPVPPPDEQRKIAAAITKIDEEHDRQQGLCKKGIGLLREYRAALITAAVTGQLDIREHEKKMEALA